MNTRLASNKNLILHTAPYYQGYEVMTHRGPLILQYLDRTMDTFLSAMSAYPNVMGLRADFRYRDNQPLPPDAHTNEVLKRFFGSLNAKIENNRRGKHHDTTVRYVWCREYGQHGRPHFHMAFLFNRQAYRSLGWCNLERDNLYTRLCWSWASALGIPVHEAQPLVHIPEEPVHQLGKNPEAFAKFFHRTSYLCKVESKQFGGWCHAFDTSRH